MTQIETTQTKQNYVPVVFLLKRTLENWHVFWDTVWPFQSQTAWQWTLEASAGVGPGEGKKELRSPGLKCKSHCIKLEHESTCSPWMIQLQFQAPYGLRIKSRVEAIQLASAIIVWDRKRAPWPSHFQLVWKCRKPEGKIHNTFLKWLLAYIP